MKVLHIIDSLGLGGAQTVVKGIFEAQRDNDDIYLFALRQREITTEIGHPNVSIFPSKSKYSLAPLFELKNIVEKNKIDVLHCHLFRSNVFGYLLKRIWFPNINLIIHEHGGIGVREKGYSLSLRLMNDKVDKYIAVSKSISKSLVDYSNITSDKISVLYNFVNLEKYSQNNIKNEQREQRTKFGFHEYDFVVGFAGRLVARKGWQDFLKAAYLLKNQKNIKFAIAGEGEDKQQMLLLIKKLQLQDSVKYLGHVSNMVEFYSKLDCFVMPSHVEPMGLTQLEAQAMGVPVLASNVEGLREVVNDKADCLLFEKGISEDLVKKIKLLVSSLELRQKLIEGGRENVKKYDLGEYVRKLDFVYESI